MPRKHKQKVTRIALSAAAVVIVALLLTPKESLVVPAWTVRVVDKGGKPAERVNVEQIWRDYSLESHDNTEIVVTGSDGIASFPKRSISASTLWRILGPIGSFLSTGVHASYGPSAWIMARKDHCLGGEVFYSPDEKMPETIVVERLNFLSECK